MKWLIPAKTFLLGEYAAVAHGSAIVLTTLPHFEMSLVDKEGLFGIHPESPAGLWWQQQNHHHQGLIWNDPYQGSGGLGASSGQFLACYLASCYLQNILPKLNAMLQAYSKSSWSGKGLKPSGYDVIAQANQGCVFINRQQNIVKSYVWPFADLSFILLRTGVKLATHHHLETASLPQHINELTAVVDKAHQAFIHADSQQLIDCVNEYHRQLKALKLVARHSVELINHLKAFPEIKAIKGCGALGADILLLLTSKQDMLSLKKKLLLNHWSILATEEQLSYLQANYFT